MTKEQEQRLQWRIEDVTKARARLYHLESASKYADDARAEVAALEALLLNDVIDFLGPKPKRKRSTTK